MKKIVILVAMLAALVLAGTLALKSEQVQDAVLTRFVTAIASGSDAPATEDALRVYVCGSASPLGRTDQAQACLAVITPEHFYLFDLGAGANRTISDGNLPMRRLKGVFLTHFHSDHIAEIYEANLASWVQGRSAPLRVLGGEGVETLVEGVNTTYQFDRAHRSEHHGEAMLPPALGILAAVTVAPGIAYEDGDLKITPYQAEHPPINPALGYRIDYKGRSVVISGDSNVNEVTVSASDGADLLLHDALSVPAVSLMSQVMGDNGRERISKIMRDVLDYHASLESLIELNDKADVDRVAYYHLVPNPTNALFMAFFERNLPENYLIAQDRMWFHLPVGSDTIGVTEP